MKVYLEYSKAKQNKTIRSERINYSRKLSKNKKRTTKRKKCRIKNTKQKKMKINKCAANRTIIFLRANKPLANNLYFVRISMY